MPKIQIRAWLVLTIKGTDKVVILKRSNKSNNAKQWDFIGGSSAKPIKPRKLIRKESLEEIGLPLIKFKLGKTIYCKRSVYFYFHSQISRKEFEKLELSHEHSKIRLLAINKLAKKKRLHHSIKIYLKNI